VLEEAAVKASANAITAVRFRPNKVWIIFSMDYISGEAASDNRENDLAAFLDINEAIADELVTGTTRFLLREYSANSGASFRLATFVPEGFDKEQYRMSVP